MRQPTTVTGWTPLWLHRSLLPVVVNEIGKLSSKYGCISPSEQGPTQKHIPVLRSLQSHGFAQNIEQDQDSLSVVLYPERSCRISTIKLWFFLPCRAVRRRRRRLFLALRCRCLANGFAKKPTNQLPVPEPPSLAPPHKPFRRRYSNSRWAVVLLNEWGKYSFGGFAQMRNL